MTLTAILFVVWLFLALSFLSYAPQDLPTKFVYHDLQEIRNLAGLPGAWCAYFLSFCFGVAGYYLVLVSGISLALFFFLDRIREPYNKALGFFLTMVAFAGLSAYVCTSQVGPPIGPGGVVGALIKFFFDKLFNPFGAYLALGAVFFFGLVMILPERALRVIFWSSGLGSFAARVTRPFLARIQAAKPQPRRSQRTAVKPVVAETAPMRRATINLSGDPFEQSPKRRTEVARAAAARAGADLSVSPLVIASDAPAARANAASRAPASAVSSAVLSERGQNTAANAPAVQGEVSELYMNAQTAGATYSDTPNDALPPAQAPESEFASADALAAPTSNEPKEYVYPSIDLLDESDFYDVDEFMDQVRERGEELERVCRSYKVELKVVDVQMGPVLTMYEVELQKGLRVKALHNLANDLEIAMKAPHVRIVSPIPGKNTVGIELPNQHRQMVRLREVMESCATEAQSMQVPIFLGKDVVGSPMVADLAKLPHLLIAGRTGTGKSVCLNSIIMSIIMTKSPQEVKLIMIDPKMVELSPYHSIPHLMHPVVTDMQKAEAILEWAVEKMEERYRLFARVGVRKLSEFNKLTPETLRRKLRPVDEDEWDSFPKSMPSIVIVADEMADLIMTSGKDVERHIVRLAQKSRAVGIHLVLATQKPTVDVVTGLIKSNLPARIAFGVASRVDSQVVLDVKGAEQLLGNGDMLFLLPGTSQLVRGQGAFVSNREIDSVIDVISVDRPNFEIEIADRQDDEEESDSSLDVEYDEFYIPSVDLVIEAGRASTSMLQRKFSIGYTRAARIIDTMTKEGLISDFNPAKPSRPRDVLVTMEEWRGKQDAAERASQNNRLNAPDFDSVPRRVEDADDHYRRPEYETAPVQTPQTVLPNGQEQAPQSAVSFSSDMEYEADAELEITAEEAGEFRAENSSQGEELQEKKDKGWSDEQWNQYMNFDSEL